MPGTLFTLYDVQGKLILTDKIETDSKIVRTNLKDGCYIIRLVNPKQTISKKLVLMNE